jgi:hypothetical protein
MPVICIGPVCVPLNLFLPFLLGILHQYGYLKFIKREWVTWAWWRSTVRRYGPRWPQPAGGAAPHAPRGGRASVASQRIALHATPRVQRATRPPPVCPAGGWATRTHRQYQTSGKAAPPVQQKAVGRAWSALGWVPPAPAVHSADCMWQTLLLAAPARQAPSAPRPMRPPAPHPCCRACVASGRPRHSKGRRRGSVPPQQQRCNDPQQQPRPSGLVNCYM